MVTDAGNEGPRPRGGLPPAAVETPMRVKLAPGASGSGGYPSCRYGSPGPEVPSAFRSVNGSPGGATSAKPAREEAPIERAVALMNKHPAVHHAGSSITTGGVR